VFWIYRKGAKVAEERKVFLKRNAGARSFLRETRRGGGRGGRRGAERTELGWSVVLGRGGGVFWIYRKGAKVAEGREGFLKIETRRCGWDARVF
jgi:hypothetical protein